MGSGKTPGPTIDNDITYVVPVTGNATSVYPPRDGEVLEQINGDLCPGGHYCPIGTAQPIPCPPGTLYYNQTSSKGNRT